MITIRPASERGNVNHGWLFARHTFSFASYYDPKHMGFRSLRVINEDTVEAGQGFGTHPHDNMEILTYVMEGRLAHKDSMGNVETIGPGEFQVMSAGTGITHSEFNHEKAARTHLYQIWIRPSAKGVTPRYDQKSFDLGDDKLKLIAAPEGKGGAMLIHADAYVYLGRIEKGDEVVQKLGADRGAWLQITKGQILLGDKPMRQGDGATIENEAQLTLTTDTGAEFLLFDLA